MIRQYELVERVQSYNPDADEALLNKAYVYAMRAHGHQTRASGDPYFSHPLEVAAILTALKLDDATIAVALLHDTIEDTQTTRAEIDALFGHEIGKLVDGLTKVNKLDFTSKQAQQAGNLRKLLLAVADDVRVLLVKLADRLHNMRTLGHVREDKRRRIAEETMDIYAPLAARMGMQDIREELEDLSFQALQPDHHAAITERLDRLNSKNIDLANEVRQALVRILAENDIDARVSGRQKRPYSIFAKMNRMSLGFEQLSDIFAFRVIVDSVQDCYRALGVIHLRWAMVPMRFKDYISLPKQNDYRSIHTTVIGPHSQRVELQIRTQDMHRVAEHGVAAHVVYKDYEALDLTQVEPHVRSAMAGKTGNGAVPSRKYFKAVHKDSRAYAWLQQTIALLAEGDSPEEFLEHTKLELFQDQVFCFTPRGRLISLPSGATPIDFAYAVHTEIGNSCSGCKINGQIRPLLSTLKNGDEVEIITSAGHTPPPVWTKIAVTGKARAAIRRATRQAVAAQSRALGLEMLEAAFRRSRRSYGEDLVARALAKTDYGSVPDLLAAVGLGDISVETVMRAIFPTRARRAARTDRKAGAAQQGDRAAANGANSAIPIKGVGRALPIGFAAGGAVPGDRIVGIITPGKGVRIYPIQASALQDFEDEPDRWLDVRWDYSVDFDGLFPARIVIAARNEPGALMQITQVMFDHGGDITNIQISGPLQDFKELTVDFMIKDLQHLNRIVADLNGLSIISSVERAFD